MRPGRTTATQWSGAPLPDPIRVSAGFLVAGLSGKIRIQILPPRLTERVIARRAASIWRAVIHAGSVVARPYSPKATVWPPLAIPDIRPRITLRCLTRRGISMASAPLSDAGRTGGRGGGGLAAALLHGGLAPGDPHLDADAPVGRVRVHLAVADVGAERAQRDATLAVPLAAAHLRATEAAGERDADALRAGFHRALDRLLHGLLVGDAARQLLRDVE